MIKTVDMKIYRTSVYYRTLKGGIEFQVIRTRSDSMKTAEAMARGKVLDDNKERYIKLINVSSIEEL